MTPSPTASNEQPPSYPVQTTLTQLRRTDFTRAGTYGRAQHTKPRSPIRPFPANNPRAPSSSRPKSTRTRHPIRQPKLPLPPFSLSISTMAAGQPPVRPIYRFFATGLGATMWFWVCLCSGHDMMEESEAARNWRSFSPQACLFMMTKLPGLTLWLQ